MSKLSKAVSQQKEENNLRLDESVTNFMGGTSYVLNPLDTLKMICASSIFGEASYYRTNVRDGRYYFDEYHSDEFATEYFKEFDGKTTTEIFEQSIDTALDYDFENTLKLAVELRKDYNMRLNPQIIMVRASIHAKRKDFTAKNPGKFAEYQSNVMSRADEPITQLTYYMYQNKGNKNKIPTILKNTIANKLSSLKPYDINKYKNHDIGMINAVRITHANSKYIDELMRTGTISVSSSETTWEQLRSNGKSWTEILSTIKLGHMALLRNLKNIFTSDEDIDVKILEDLKQGVKTGKQFPFRYFNAYNRIFNEPDYKLKHKTKILDTLEECVDISIENMPKLKGTTVCLSDNSGSAWGTIPTEYGSVKIAEIDNLSSVIAGILSDEGYVCKFGNSYKMFPVSKRNGVLNQTKEISKCHAEDVKGGGTEGGIWQFFNHIIRNKIHYDNIFIFSDMQAGTGELYGNDADYVDYYQLGYSENGRYINVFKLILDYRKKVNPKVNVFSVQTAGYSNILIPQMSYRCAMLTGWTGKEILFANEFINQWNELENRSK